MNELLDVALSGANIISTILLIFVLLYWIIVIIGVIDIESLDGQVLSYKSAVIEWAQKNKKEYHFETKEDLGLDPKVNYSSTFFINKKQVAKAREISKKKAEEKVARRGYYALKIKSINR